MNRWKSPLVSLFFAGGIILVYRAAVAQEETVDAEESQVQQSVAASRGTRVIKGLGLKVRNATEQEFSDETKQYGVEYVRDEDVGFMLIANDQGGIAIVDRPRFAISHLNLRDGVILLRCDTYTGETWETEKNGTHWIKIEEDTPTIAKSFYELLVPNSYFIDETEYHNINRIDRNTGQTWYEKDMKWHPYEVQEQEAQ